MNITESKEIQTERNILEGERLAELICLFDLHFSNGYVSFLACVHKICAFYLLRTFLPFDKTRIFQIKYILHLEITVAFNCHDYPLDLSTFVQQCMSHCTQSFMMHTQGDILVQNLESLCSL